MPLLRHEGLVVRDSLGAWVTEAGFHVDGFTVALPGEFVSLADPDPREVAELAYFPTAQVRAAPVRPAYHLVDPRDHRHGPEAVMFESPTIELRHPDTGDPWVLWGLAGYMVAEWQAHELRS